MRSYDASLFREEAIVSRGKTERLDVLPQVTAPHEWLVLAGLALVLLGVGAWGVFGGIERRLTTACLLVQPGDRHAVLAEVSGTVTEVLVDTGDPVQPGQTVARVSRPELRRAIRIARARIPALEAGPGGEPLRAARAELADLELVESVGDVIVSPYAGTVAALALTPGQPVAAGTEVARIRSAAAGGVEAGGVHDAGAGHAGRRGDGRSGVVAGAGRAGRILDRGRRAGGFRAPDFCAKLACRNGISRARSRSACPVVPAERA